MDLYLKLQGGQSSSQYVSWPKLEDRLAIKIYDNFYSASVGDNAIGGSSDKQMKLYKKENNQFVEHILVDDDYAGDASNYYIKIDVKSEDFDIRAIQSQYIQVEYYVTAPVDTLIDLEEEYEVESYQDAIIELAKDLDGREPSEEEGTEKGIKKYSLSTMNIENPSYTNAPDYVKIAISLFNNGTARNFLINTASTSEDLPLISTFELSKNFLGVDVGESSMGNKIFKSEFNSTSNTWEIKNGDAEIAKSVPSSSYTNFGLFKRGGVKYFSYAGASSEASRQQYIYLVVKASKLGNIYKKLVDSNNNHVVNIITNLTSSTITMEDENGSAKVYNITPTNTGYTFTNQEESTDEFTILKETTTTTKTLKYDKLNPFVALSGVFEFSANTPTISERAYEMYQFGPGESDGSLFKINIFDAYTLCGSGETFNDPGFDDEMCYYDGTTLSTTSYTLFDLGCQRMYTIGAAKEVSEVE